MLNKSRNILKISGILVLVSTSIFACKQRKQRKLKEKEAQKQDVIQEVKEAKDSTPSLFVIPKPDTTIAKIPINVLYVKSCGVCHEPYPKERYNAVSWGHILDSMQMRAHISDPNKADLYRFLTGDTLKLD